jgi:hypothetical protein
MRQTLLRDFLEVHNFSMMKALHSAIYVRGGSFDYKNEVFSFKLRYRSDCGGNASIAFRLLNGELLPMSDVYRGSAIKTLEAGRPTRDHSDARLKEDKDERDHYLGLIICIFNMDDWSLVQTYAHWRISDKDPIKTIYPTIPHERWLFDLQRCVNEGFVFEEVETEYKAWRLGKMVQHGKKWEWVMRTPDEVAQLGLPRNFNDVGLLV